MNAKKLVSVSTLALASLAMLAGCGSSSSSPKTLTRTEAVTTLNGIADKTTAQTKGVITKSNGAVINVAENFISVTYSAATTITVNSSSETIDANTAIYAYRDGDNYSYYQKSGSDDAKLYTTANNTLFAGVTTKISTYLGYATYASAFAKYLGNFNDDGSAVATGGTAKGATLVKQSYTSTGDGNLSLDITAHYSYDEQLVYAWDKNQCVNYRGSTCVWGSATTTLPTDGGTSLSDIEGTILATMVIASL